MLQINLLHFLCVEIISAIPVIKAIVIFRLTSGFTCELILNTGCYFGLPTEFADTNDCSSSNAVESAVLFVGRTDDGVAS